MADESHRRCLGSETDPLVDASGQAATFDQSSEKHMLISRSEVATPPLRGEGGVGEEGGQGAGSTSSSVCDQLGHPVTQAHGLWVRTVKGEGDKGG